MGVDEEIFRWPGAFRFEGPGNFLMLGSSNTPSGLSWKIREDGGIDYVLGGLVSP